MSMLIFAGSGQFVLAGLWGAGAGALSVIVAVFVVNLRHLLMSAALAEYLAPLKRWQRFLFGCELTDETFGVHIGAFQKGWQLAAATLYSCNITAHAAWVGGTVAGLTPTGERVAGAPIRQSSAVPTLHAQRVATVYGVILHILTVLLLVASGVAAAVALGVRLRQGIRRRRPVFGFSHGFGRALALLVMMTALTLLLFAAAMGRIVMSVVDLAWGGSPAHDPGIMYWSWPVAQVACTLVVWEWSSVLVRLIEVASVRGILQLPPRKGAVREIVTGEQPVLASRRLGRVTFWLAGASMFAILLVFAFWGLFSYTEPLVY